MRSWKCTRCGSETGAGRFHRRMHNGRRTRRFLVQHSAPSKLPASHAEMIPDMTNADLHKAVVDARARRSRHGRPVRDCRGVTGTSTIPLIEPSGWARSSMPASAAEPNDSTSNWTCCSTCPSKRAEPCWRKVASMPSPPSYGRFPLWGRFAPPWRWR